MLRAEVAALQPRCLSLSRYHGGHCALPCLYIDRGPRGVPQFVRAALRAVAPPTHPPPAAIAVS
jgi:hypothetical protein